MTSDVAAIAEAARVEAAKARRAAEAARVESAHNGQILAAIKSAIGRIEEHVERTNGRVTALEMWKVAFVAELKGIAQGTGGTGRLLVYVLGAGASAGAIVVAAFNIAQHFK